MNIGATGSEGLNFNVDWSDENTKNCYDSGANMTLLTNVFRLFSTTILCVTIVGVFAGLVQADTHGSDVFSLELKQVSLKKVLEKISELSGYEIYISGSWPHQAQISINLQHTSIEDALSRVLYRVNHAVKWDMQQRKLTVFLFPSFRHEKGRKLPAVFDPPAPGSSKIRFSSGPNVSGTHARFTQGTPTGNFDP